MLGNLFRKGNAHERFWNWFQEHGQELRAIRTGQERIVGALTNELQRVHRGLRWEFSAGEDEDVKEFIVSADGDKSIFPAVRQLVDSAPVLNGWKVLAFRQRKTAAQIEFGGRTVTPDDVYFSSEGSDGKLDVRLYIDGLTDENERHMQEIAFLLLDAVVGEYDVETYIGVIDFLPLTLADGRQQPLSKLPAAVDGIKTA